MRRVKNLGVVVCFLVMVVLLSSTAFAVEVGVGASFSAPCPLCNEFVSLKITSFQQATESSAGFFAVFCSKCGRSFSRSTKYWGANYVMGESLFGLYDVILYEFDRGVPELCFISFYRPSTCTEQGSRRIQRFSIVNYAIGGSLFALGHDYKETSRTSATCIAPGSVVSICSRCQNTKTESLPVDPNAHTWTETSRTPVSCVSGIINYTCSVCSQTKTEPLPADPNAHTWTETSRTPATCLPGSIEYTCSICHDTKIESIPALENAHTYEIEEIVPAEYDSAGNLLTASYIRYACSACGDSYNSTIGGNISGPIINEGEGGNGMGDATAALGKTFLSGLWALFGIYVPGFSFTFGQMWLGVLLASISILVVRMMFGFGGSGSSGVSSRTGSTNNPKISKERRHDEF